MNKKLALILYYNRPNKYSFNALAGALETDDYFKNLRIYFPSKEENLFSDVGKAIDVYEKVIIGISFHTTQIWDEDKLIKNLKKKFGNKPLYIAGGPHPTGDQEGTLNMGFDIVVKGEGEETIIELLKAIDNDYNYADIKGISYYDKDGKFCVSGRRTPINLDDYPPFAVNHSKFGPIEITRGCPFVCYFCQTPQIFGGRVRHRSVENICEHVEIMKSRNLSDIRFITPNSFSYGSPDGRELNIVKLEELLSSIRKILNSKGKIFFGSFPSEVRPEHVTEETIDLVLKYADNDNLIIGAQSGSQRVLDLCHRGHTVADIYTSVELTLKAGLKANVDFIFGLPGETREDIELTIKMMSYLVEAGARIHAHTFIPLPQTPFSKSLVKRRIDKKTKKMINNLIPKGVVYGDWREQEEMALKIAKYLRSGRLEV
jgi:B12-binding domain/radical SAM domain protein